MPEKCLRASSNIGSILPKLTNLPKGPFIGLGLGYAALSICAAPLPGTVNTVSRLPGRWTKVSVYPQHVGGPWRGFP
jgi:hypothetical protein